MATHQSDHVHIEQWRKPVGVNAQAIITVAMAECASEFQTRRRDLRKTERGIVTALLSDLIYREVEGVYAEVICPRNRNATRYDYPPLKSRRLEPILQWLKRSGWIVLTDKREEKVPDKRGGWRIKRYASTIRAGVRLERAIEKHKPTRSDFRIKSPEVNVVRLKTSKRLDHWEQPQEDQIVKMDYLESPTAQALRSMTRVINKHLLDINIQYVGRDDDPDLDLRHLTRYFIERPNEREQGYIARDKPIPKALAREPSFGLSGRYYGGFWMNMKREYRWDLRINGEQAFEVDWSALFLHLAYHQNNLATPPGDLYAIPGLEREDRGSIKQLVNSMFNYDRDFTHPPKGVVWTKKMTTPKATKLIKEYHHLVADMFGNPDLGLQLMNKESNMMTICMMACMNDDIPALPLHDGIITTETQADTVAGIMMRVYRESNHGHECPVTVERKGKKIKRYGP